jgi:hypothetical protein
MGTRRAASGVTWLNASAVAKILTRSVSTDENSTTTQSHLRPVNTIAMIAHQFPEFRDEIEHLFSPNSKTWRGGILQIAMPQGTLRVVGWIVRALSSAQEAHLPKRL